MPTTLHCIAPYGHHPHPEGLQIFNERIAQQLVHHFNGFYQRLKRSFRGLPIYIGHPDHPAFSGQKEHNDFTLYGTIISLEARKNGLYAHIQWTPKGQILIDEKKYRFFSPHWKLEHLSADHYYPIHLISLGLTNTPNIPGLTIANEGLPLKQKSQTEHLRYLHPGSKADQKHFLKTVKACQKQIDEPYITTWARAKKTA